MGEVGVISSVEQFQKEIKYEGLTVIDYHAVWCGPCKVLSPRITKLAEENPNAHFWKVDVDEVPALAQEQGVSAMPTIHFFKNGEQLDTVVGANVQKIMTLVKDHV